MCICARACSYKPSTHTLHTLALEAAAGALSGVELPSQGALCIFLVGDLAAIEPLYGEHAMQFMKLEAGYMTELLLNTASEAGVALQESYEAAAACMGDSENGGGLPNPEFKGRFQLSETHRVLHALVGGSFCQT